MKANFGVFTGRKKVRMTTTKSQKRRWTHLFRCHVFPSKKSPSLSVYETLFYILLLALCFWAYGKVNSITTHYYTVEAECLNAKLIKERWNCKIIPSATVKFSIPMTESYHDTLNSSVTLKTFTPQKAAKERFCYLLDYCNKGDNRCDSLRMVYYQHVKAEEKDSSRCLYYIKTTQSLTDMLYNKALALHPDSIGKSDLKGTSIVKRKISDGYCYQETYNMFSSLKICSNTWGVTDTSGMLLSNPGWFAACDISQAYYEIKLNSLTIDSLTLDINFVGAADFSEMIPKPDVVTMSAIKFIQPEKIQTIKKNGLRFHAKFKELENRQTIRLFFLTAFMCTLLSTLLPFFVIGFYRVICKINNANKLKIIRI